MDPPEDFAFPLLGRSAAFIRLTEQLEAIGASDASVLIQGESGTGKELVARLLHACSARRLKPFVTFNCGAFPEGLLEAELFGHERGAFTGAVRKREGRFKAADGGTLLLDEVGELSLTAQVKLLRVLQESTVEPLGTNASLRVNVRVLSATNKNLRQEVAEGRFREDLYYRLNVLDVSIPPLRERREDIPVLVEHFLREFTPLGVDTPKLTPRAYATLMRHPFRGNVRELAHALERAVVLARGHDIDVEHLSEEIAGARDDAPPGEGFLPLSEAMREFERMYLMRALQQTDGNRTRCAQLLGISRKNLWEKLRLHGLSEVEFEASSTALAHPSM